MGRITGLGGAFLKAKYRWYERQLGIKREEHGSFSFPKSEVTGSTALAFFPQDTGYFGAGDQRAMLNFRVDDLDGLLEALTAAGVDVEANRETCDFGKFAWLTDPKANQVELWEPLGPALGTVPEQGAQG